MFPIFSNYYSYLKYFHNYPQTKVDYPNFHKTCHLALYLSKLQKHSNTPLEYSLTFQDIDHMLQGCCRMFTYGYSL